MAKAKDKSMPVVRVIPRGARGMKWTGHGGVGSDGGDNPPRLDIYGLKTDDLHDKPGPRPLAPIFRKETRRLFAAGLVPRNQTRSGLARELEKWFPGAHPDLPAPRWNAIRNMIRPTWDELY
jgi:hypothetical protein